MRPRTGITVAALAIAATLMAATLIAGQPAGAAASSSSCDTSQLRQVPGPAQALAGSVPVVFIHGIISKPKIWGPSSPSSIAGQAASISGVTGWTFGYAAESLDWVTNKAIGPAFAAALACLAHASGQKAVIVAHSMGGLATQYAVAQPDPYGGTVADHVAEVVTLGTPYSGSRLLSDMQALRHGAKVVLHPQYALAAAILSLCAGKTSGICALLNVMPAPVGTALEAGSSQIAQLPPWPAGLPVLDTAGDIDLRFGAGRLSVHAGFGDGVVGLGSATGHDTAGAPVILHCNAVLTVLGTDELHNPGPCFHTLLPHDQLIITAVLAVIRANIAPPCSAPQMFAAAEAKEHFSASSPGYSKTIRPGASDPVCDGTWALASVSRPNVGGTDGFTLFRAQDGAWAEVADVGGVPADCILEEQGVPATVARVLWPPAQSAPASICQQ